MSWQRVRNTMKTIAEQYHWNDNYIPFTVEEGRQLAAPHGMDVAVIIGYNVKKNTYSVITVGKTRPLADEAVKLGDAIMDHINPLRNTSELLEDRRNEHPA